MSVLTAQLDCKPISEADYPVVLLLIDACDERGLISNYKDVRAEIMDQQPVNERDVFLASDFAIL